MTTLLRIDASARGARSLSRRMTQSFIARWLQARPDDAVLERDLAREPPPFVTEPWIASAFTEPALRTPEQHRLLEASDRLIDEVEKADVIVLGTPMYNYGMPATLKAWFDQVIRIGRTFSFDLARGDWPLEPVLGGKTLVVLSSRGEFGFAPGGVRARMNHLDPHIATCARYLGVAESHLITTEYQEFGGARHEHSSADAHRAIAELVEELTSRADSAMTTCTETACTEPADTRSGDARIAHGW